MLKGKKHTSEQIVAILRRVGQEQLPTVFKRRTPVPQRRPGSPPTRAQTSPPLPAEPPLHPGRRSPAGAAHTAPPSRTAESGAAARARFRPTPFLLGAPPPRSLLRPKLGR
jgi:hypothetical protein